MNFDIDKIRLDFPILSQVYKGKKLIYLDSAASSQKPNLVIEAEENFYKTYNANIHRGVYYLSEKATHAYENSRKIIQSFINAKEVHEIIFTKGATEAINLIAQTYAKNNLKEKDEILITTLEHHSNIVPWQMIAQSTGAILKVTPINEEGELILSEFENLLSEKTKLVAIAHMSNALGTINPIKEMIRKAHEYGAKVLIDGAQALPHISVDVQDLDCDFYVASGHKALGPTGIGFLYGKTELLEAMPPYQGGGDMILSVDFNKTIYAPLPQKFEAGTPNIAGAIGFGVALSYLSQIGLNAIYEYENYLLTYATNLISTLPSLKIIGTAQNKGGIISFTLKGIHPHDIGTFLSEEGIAVRTGHHCAMPLMKFFNIPATTRLSFMFYNTLEEIDIFFDVLKKIKQIFNR